jgi:signal transduction histidine kinase/ActR/RegA family two-component response regulator
MARLRDLPIRRKLLVIGIATSLCALLISTAVFLWSTLILGRSRAHTDLTTQAAIVADNSTAALAFGDSAAEAETLRALHAKTSIDLACAYDRAGALFAEAKQSEAVPDCPSVAPADVDAITAEAVRVSRPVVVGGRRVGTVYLLGNLDEVWQRLRIQAAAAFLGMVVATVAAFFIASRLQYIISGPIASLADTAAAITRGGNYGLRAVRDGHDEIGALVDAFNDMVGQVELRSSERIELLRREQQANRLKDEFLAALSHELRTPLNAILGWIQILRSAPPAPETMERALNSLERNARAQTRLIEDLLDVSRIVSGKLHLKVADVDFTAVVESAIDVIRPAADAKQITIASDLRADRCVLRGDADRLRQVVWNLLSNAVKFTPHGGRVEVSVTTSPSTCELAVRDNGIGVAAEFVPYMFDRFRQADGSTTRQHGGLGLGLAIVREVTQAHGGQVRVESAGAGHGATFILTLPVIAMPVGAVRPPAAAPPAAPPRLDGIAVLVVDDNADARDVARAALTAAGADVDAAPGAPEALARAAARRFDALVCDLAMPGVDGYTLLGELRALDARTGHFTPAIAVSAFADREAEARARHAGYEAFLVKPYTITALVAAVAAARARQG